MGLRKKMLILVVVMAVLPITAIGIRLYNLSRHTIIEKLQLELRDRLGLVEGRISSQMLDLEGNLKGWASDEALVSMDSAAGGKVQKFLLKAANSHRLLSHLSVFDRNGNLIQTTNLELASLAHVVGKKVVPPNLSSWNLKQVLLGEQQGLLSGILGRNYFSVPIYQRFSSGKKQVIGALVAKIKLKEFSTLLAFANEGRDESLGINIYLSAGKNVLDQLINENRKVTFKSLLEENYRFFTVLQEVILNHISYQAISKKISMPIKGMKADLTLTAIQASTVAFRDLDILFEAVLVTGLSMMVFALILGFIMAQSVVRPIINLKAFVEKITAEGDFHQRISIKGKDEIAVLSLSFNHLLEQISTSRAQLEDYNQNLEKTIKKRTNEISALQVEMTEMLNGMKQGVLTFDQDLKVNPVFSACLSEVINVSDIADQNIIYLITNESTLHSDDVRRLEWELSHCFGVSPFQFEMSTYSLPRKVVKRKDTGNISIRLTWQGIFENDKLIRVLLVMEDVTELEVLEDQAREKQIELERLGAMVKIEPYIFEDFVEESNVLEKSCEKLLAQLDDEPDRFSEVIDELFRSVHTLKGHARMFSLTSIIDITHSTEEFLDQLRRGETDYRQEMKGQLSEKVQLILDDIKAYIKTRNEYFAGNEGFGVVDVHTTNVLRIAAYSLKMAGFHSLGDELLQEVSYRLTQDEMIDFTVYIRSYEVMLQEMAAITHKSFSAIQITGETLIDKSLSKNLNKILIHCLSNSLDHALEAQSERIASGKPAEGTIKINFEHKSDLTVVSLVDDGRGMNPDMIAKIAREQGIVTDKDLEGMTDEDKLNLIFEPSFSSKTEITNISGRGVGMDAVRTIVDEARGHIKVESTVGKGSSIHISMPRQLNVQGRVALVHLPTMLNRIKDQIENAFSLQLSEIQDVFLLGDMMLMWDFFRDLASFCESCSVITISEADSGLAFSLDNEVVEKVEGFVTKKSGYYPICFTKDTIVYKIDKIDRVNLPAVTLSISNGVSVEFKSHLESLCCQQSWPVRLAAGLDGDILVLAPSEYSKAKIAPRVLVKPHLMSPSKALLKTDIEVVQEMPDLVLIALLELVMGGYLKDMDSFQTTALAG